MKRPFPLDVLKDEVKVSSATVGLACTVVALSPRIPNLVTRIGHHTAYE